MTAPKSPHDKSGDQNRRTWSRMSAGAIPGVRATLSSGATVELVNVSRGGAQFRTASRMLPGLSVTLRLVTADGQLTMKGRVVRSTMVKMANGTLGYEVGVSFDQELPGAGPAPAQKASTDAAASREPGSTSAPASSGTDPDPGNEVLGPDNRPAGVSVSADVGLQSLEGLLDILEKKK